MICSKISFYRKGKDIQAFLFLPVGKTFATDNPGYSNFLIIFMFPHVRMKGCYPNIYVTRSDQIYGKTCTYGVTKSMSTLGKGVKNDIEDKEEGRLEMQFLE